ncbi:MAG: hypothetical protein AUH85_03535 [Chloroflexi bacterium 13_1_40CM_4_68_4]|nr:MAG: hypothetical protein AUH85_03535 [Chloroflexi bacterium 13_1_40CM_4_68_4]
MAEATFPLPGDVTEEERRQLREGLARYARILGEEDRAIKNFQYIRIYRIATGFLAIGHDLREGIKIVFAERAEDLPARFEPDTVREFVEDELRFRKVIDAAGAGTH